MSTAAGAPRESPHLGSGHLPRFLIPTLIVALAALLRFYDLRHAAYMWDDDGIWSRAVDAVTQHVLPSGGIMSTLGVANGPFQLYLLMPLAALGQQPIAGIALVAGLNVLAVAVVYRFVAEFFGPRAAAVAALLFAVNSWAVMYAREIIVQGLLFPFQALFFWNAARWLARGRGGDLVLTFLWLAILMQVYVDGLLQAGAMAAILALGWRQLRPRPFLAGAAVWALLTGRYLVLEILPHLEAFRPAASESPRIDASSLWNTLLQATHSGFETLVPDTRAVPAGAGAIEQALLLLEAGLFAAGAAYGLWQLLQSARRGRAAQARVLALLWVWFALPIVVFLRHTDLLTWRHLAVDMPLPPIFIGLLLARSWPWPGAVLLALVSGNSLALAGLTFAVIPTCRDTTTYGLSYAQTFALAGSLKELAAGNGAGEVYVNGHPTLAPILSSILSRQGVRSTWSDDPASDLPLAPAGQAAALYVTTSDDTGPAGYLQAAFPGRLLAAADLPCADATVRSYVINRDAMAASFGTQLPFSLGLHAASGIDLRRIGADRQVVPGGSIRAGLLWSWRDEAQQSKPYWLFVHLLDGSGQLVASRDEPLPSQPGQDIVQWFDLPVPPDVKPGRYSLELGVYDANYNRSPLTDDSGKSLGSSALWGPLAVPRSSQPAANLTPTVKAFGGELELDGYGASVNGSQVDIQLEWQALRPPSHDYTVFVHVLDSTGHLVAQADSQPQGGDFPTSTWRPGERVLDVHSMNKLGPGDYTVEAGPYYLPTLERLAGPPLQFSLHVPG